MRTLRKIAHQLPSIFFILFVFQSCRVYHNTTVSMERVAEAPEWQWIKVKMKNGEVHHFRSIYEQNGHLFGCSTKKRDYVLFATRETLESIQLQNKDLSLVGNSLIVVGVGTLAGLILWQELKPKFDFGTFSYP